jgi:putative transposase
MKRGRSKIDYSVYPLFITTTITDHIPVFRDHELARRVLHLLEERRQYHEMHIYAYVLMPSHFHAITKAPQRGETSRFMASWKSLAAREILNLADSSWLEAFAAAATKYKEPGRKSHKVWMTRFDDLALYDQNTFATKFEYIHNNPVKAGLVKAPEDYAFCSAGFYSDAKDEKLVTITDCRPFVGRS